MLRSSWDDACASDIRVAKLMTRYGIETTFYIPVEWHSLAYQKGYEPISWQDVKVYDDHEIGSHTITHQYLTRLPIEVARCEIVDSREMLEKMFDTKITKFCPPRGYTNSELTNITLEVYESQRLTKGEGLVHIHPNSGANKEIPWRDYAKTLEVKEIWGHSWELDKFDLWNELEEFLIENIHS